MSTEAVPRSGKQMALEALRQMPEAATLEQMSEELAILAAIRRGEEAADAGRVLTHEEVTRRSASWIPGQTGEAR
jgi:predicted transcriptional regulator